MSGLNRRDFLGLASGVAAATVLGGVALSPQARAAQAFDPGPAAGRTLVVLDMQGGNDPLNSLIPATGRYHDLRPTIGLNDDELLSFDGLDYGVNPALAGLRSFWDDGQLAAIYGVGLPEQTRSHFVAQEAWRSAQPGQPSTSGWLGRWLEATETSAELPLRAIALGGSTLAAQGETGRPVAVQSVDDYQLRPPWGHGRVTRAFLEMGLAPDESLQGQAQAAIPKTVESVDHLQEIIASTRGAADELEPDPISALFAATQAIIQADVGTQVLYITMDGFDTHAGQRVRHEALLETIATGFETLFAELATTGHAERTLALTVSEFGRRAEENASAGTDHGNGGLSLLMGPAVAESTMVGDAGLDDLVDGDLPTQIDTRTVYDNALRWLGSDDDVIEEVIGSDWESIDVLRAL